MKEKNYYTLIPEKVNENIESIDNYFTALSINGYCLDNLREVISLISFHAHKNEENWANLKIEYLRKYVPHAELYLKALINNGIVETNNSYSVSVTSKRYRFTDDYLSRYVKLPVQSPKLVERIMQAQHQMKRYNSKKYPIQNDFIRKMTIIPEAYKFIETNYSGDLDRYNYAFASATRVDNKDFYYTVDDTSGRYHSNLTNMPNHVIHFVRIKQVPIRGVDIKNSQPYFSTLILTAPSKIAHFAKYHCLRNLLQNLQVKQTDDVQQYIKLVTEGQLYEFLLEEFQKRGLKYMIRDEVKRQVLIILFDRNSHNSVARQVFAELFPEVDRVFSLIRGYERGVKFKSFQRFAILLQTIEAHVVLDIIVPRINMEYPGIITATKHDSILTGDCPLLTQIVHKVMEEEITKFVGYKPKLKIE